MEHEIESLLTSVRMIYDGREMWTHGGMLTAFHVPCFKFIVKSLDIFFGEIFYASESLFAKI